MITSGSIAILDARAGACSQEPPDAHDRLQPYAIDDTHPLEGHGLAGQPAPIVRAGALGDRRPDQLGRERRTKSISSPGLDLELCEKWVITR